MALNNLNRAMPASLWTFIGIFVLSFASIALSGGVLAAEISNVRIGQTTEKTRVEFQLDYAKHYTITALSNPERLVIDFYQVQNKLNFDDKSINDSRIQSIKVQNSPNRTRIILGLHQAADFKTHGWISYAKANQKDQRLVLDLISSTQTAHAAPAQKSTPIPPASSSPKPAIVAVNQATAVAAIVDVKNTTAAKSESEHVKVVAPPPINQAITQTIPPSPDAVVKPVESKPLVSVVQIAHAPRVNKDIKSNLTTSGILDNDSAALTRPADIVVAIDAGHGGKDVGAIGHGNVYEKDVTLQMAKEIKAVIDAQPGMRAVLTRDRDVYIGLADRVKIAKQKRRLFLFRYTPMPFTIKR
nr:N-acetylmuramoyl-L-alanine amidase [Thiomicrorhabdus aquaedulcis]